MTKDFPRRMLSYIERKAVADFIKSAYDGKVITKRVFETLSHNLGWVYLNENVQKADEEKETQ